MQQPAPSIMDSVDRACKRAAGTSAWMDQHPHLIADWMLRVADELVSHRDELLSIACDETHLYPAELEPEWLRTIQNLRSFAVVAARRRPVAAVGGAPSTQCDLQLLHVPLGPVAVFGASNFPLAYGYLGTDASSALAAGCPVIVKSHPLQPRTYALQAEIARRAAHDLQVPEGVMQLLDGPVESTHALGVELVSHPLIRAIGFTGSVQGGLALQRVAQQRSSPVPFFGELGSVNPQLILPHALTELGPSIAAMLSQSLSARAGQQCTCPGVWIILHEDPDSDCHQAFYRAASDLLMQSPPRRLLSPAIGRAYQQTCQAWLNTLGVFAIFTHAHAASSSHADHQDALVRPLLAQARADLVLNCRSLLGENFGPAALIVTCQTAHEVHQVLEAIGGTLVASLWAGPGDMLEPWPATLAQIAGRVVLHGVPTGVRVSPSMQHGGPFPASTRPDSSAVGDRSILRWQRPVTIQGWQEL